MPACRPLVRELNAQQQIRIKNIAADKVMRHFLRGMVGHNGHYACEFGVGKGCGRLGWPFPDCLICPERTDAQIRGIIR